MSSLFFMILGLIIGMFVLRLIIQILNYRHRLSPLPDNVKHLYDKEKYEKWLSYTMTNFKFSMVSQSFNTLLLVALLAFGFYGWLESYTVSLFEESELLQNLAFLFLFFIIDFVLGIPFKYYRIFVIEAKFGFNKTTKQLFLKDLMKSIILTVTFGGGLMYVLYRLFSQFEDIWVFMAIAYLVIAFVMLTLFLFNGVFVRWFNKLTPLEEGSLKEKIDALGTKLGFQVKRIFVMDASKRSTKLNAFFSGLGKTREVVLFDTLIEKSSEEEIVAVLAHELGHAVHKDTTRGLIQQYIVIMIYVALLGLIFASSELATAFGLSGVHFGFSFILMSILLEPIELLLGIPLNYLSRVAEFKADAFAKKHTSKEAMEGALKVLAVENFSNLTPHPLLVFLSYSHPPIDQRLKALE
jgi:STE24 endopeptidase